jgi:hypothetical protein
VVVGVVVVVEVEVDVLVVDHSVVVVEATTSVCVDAGTAESETEVAALDIGSSSGVTIATLAVVDAAAAVGKVDGGGGRVSTFVTVTVERIDAAPVALTAGRLDTTLQRRLPQHRIIQLRTCCPPAFIFQNHAK